MNKLDTIVINRKEPSGRRAYDLGHELFHVLTWNSMPPPSVDADEAPSKRQKRIEDLANNFTSALLMPAQVVRNLFTARGSQDLRSWICDAAGLLEVSAQALYWRLVRLECIPQGAEGIEPAGLTTKDASPTPKLYSSRFVRCLQRGIDGGLVSVRRVQEILDKDLDDLEAVFREHNLNVPFELVGSHPGQGA